MKLIELEEVDSTNDYLKRQYKNNYFCIDI